MAGSVRDFLLYRCLPVFLKISEAIENYSRLWEIRHPVRVSENRKAYVFFSHGRGGGVERFMHERIAELTKQNIPTHIITFDLRYRCFRLDGKMLRSAQSLAEVLAKLGAAHLHIEQLRYYPYRFVVQLPEFAEAIGATYEVMLHDFMPLCPRIHLMTERWSYCGMPQDLTACESCIKQRGSLTVNPSVKLWRETWRRIFASAKGVSAPSLDTASRFSVFFQGQAIGIAEMEKPQSLQAQRSNSQGQGWIAASASPPRNDVKHNTDTRIRLIALGNIYALKGANLLVDCARDAQARTLPLSFAVIGNCTRSNDLQALGVPVSGAYAHKDVPRLLRESGARAVLLLSTWPETYSYVLSEIWENDYLPIAFDFGAPAERIRASGKGALLPLSCLENPAAINDHLLGILL